ncbi:uncharacterized protein LOC120180918 [Hibiscus syriacus]|uniref:uncharacterized protein LOC120180918 n=1 Tax=Hibiscus syriacus TaxID=106335 RepID=UPI0019219A29|nr:uncharacterized protein LOC120180918 [Hibiscus syriacus]
MAAAFATPSSVFGLGGSATSLLSPSKKTPLSSGFLRCGATARNSLRLAGALGGRFTCFERDWLRRDLNVIGFGLIGWLAPSSIPAIDGKSFTGLFFDSIGTELAHFPTPPALTAQFWLWLVLWHLGLFITLSHVKTAATLWEINKISSPPAKEELEKNDRRRKAPRVLKMAHTLPPSLSDPSYSPISEKMDRSRIKSHKRRSLVVYHKLELTDYKLGSSDFVGNACLIETETHSKGKNHAGCITGTETRLKDIRNSLTTSKELLKVLNHVCGLQERHSSTTSLISSLRIELDRARTGVDHLIREPRSYCDEMEHFMRHFAEEKAAWKRKGRERIRDAIACVADELEVEKKLRRQTERLNKKLGKELADTKASQSKATKELEGEKRAKEILEQVSDEFAKGIGEDRALTEELKRETAIVREEVEKEREMLQFADVLREERLQMKLSEAKHQF